MNHSNQPSAAPRLVERFPSRTARRRVVVALALGILLAGCGASKPAATQPSQASSTARARAALVAETRQQRATLLAAAAQRRSRLAAARRSELARAARLRAERAAAARKLAAQAAAARKLAAQAAAARKLAAQAAARKQTKTTPPAPAHTTPSPSGTVVSLSRTALGSVLVDAQGRTLYLFEKDPPNQSACSAACAAVWPPLTTNNQPAAGQGAIQSELGTTRRPGGNLQVTYHSHPLYLYAGDSRSGQTSGESLDQFGAQWWAISAAGQKVTP